MSPKYDPGIIEGHFDKHGAEEWERLDKDPIGRVQFHIHQHYLQKYVRKGDRVLEIGPGPGRFTIELAKLGTSIGIVDISSEQLRLNEKYVREFGFEEAVEWRKKLDILNLDGIPDNSFDATVCYGGPLSYALDHVHKALNEVIRVTKPDGYILASVMSSLGTYHHLIGNVFEAAKEMGLEVFDELTRTGDVMGKLAANGTHQCHMYRWSELRDILSEHPVEILDASACNFLSNGLANEEMLSSVMNDPDEWQTFLQWELDFSREPGAIDGGTHMIVILKKLSKKP
ncbi:MAG: class I SAM-dependent methyltransferase [Candidatus Thorarchaeota archaeon]|jgi:ubiquinone/menaquinone biosynthesis C-methylase UbiE